MQKIFSKKNNAKLKADVFVGPDIRDLMKDEKFDHRLNSLELGAWKSFKQVIRNFLDGKKSENYADVVRDMLIRNQKLDSRMCLKNRFLHSLLNFFS